MNNTQIEAEAGRRAEFREAASFREALDQAVDAIVGAGMIDAMATADWTDEELAASLVAALIRITLIQDERLKVARSLQTAVDLQQQLSATAEMMNLANKTLKLMLEEAQAREAWIAKKGLAGPERRHKKAA